MTAPPSPPPGWYFDGVGQRWWDGAAWGPAAPSRAVLDEERGRALAVFANLGFVGMWFVLPLVIRVAGRDNPFVKHHASEALNFQILFGIIWNAALLPGVLSGSPFSRGAFIGLAIALSALLANLVLSVVGAVRASRGEGFRYPVNLRLVRGAVVVPRDANGRRIRTA